MFGGTTTTIFGVTPITKLDVLQIGPPRELEHRAHHRAQAKGGSTSPPRTPNHSPKPQGSFLDGVFNFGEKEAQANEYARTRVTPPFTPDPLRPSESLDLVLGVF